MQKTNLIFILVLVSFAFTAFAQETENNMGESQKKWMEYMTPGPMHEMMAKTAGDWKTKSTFWMTPDSKPLVTEGTAKFEMIMGGRYLKSTHKGMMMGMSFEGMNLQGYDNATKEFTAVWIDNMGTGTSVSTGKYDENSNSISFNGTMIDPVSGKNVSYRQVIKLIDDNHQVVEMYTEYEGEEYKSMEVELTR